MSSFEGRSKKRRKGGRKRSGNDRRRKGGAERRRKLRGIFVSHRFIFKFYSKVKIFFTY